jgi:dTDP-4-amino-4,6-dideoxygalactose transaminase
MKARIEDLAVLGGPPAFPESLHVGRPNIGSLAAFQRRAQEMTERRWLTNDGPFMREFEARVAEYVGVRHCVALSSGTKALELLMRAAELEGEVIVPSFTFVGTAHAVLWTGLSARFCDIDPASHTLDPDRVEELVGPRTSAIVGVHIWGRPCRIEALTEIAARRGVKLFFDAAHAFASSHKGQMIGSFGGAEIFSFHATKLVQSCEGGAVVTNDRALAERVRLLRNFGFRDYDDVIALGTNGKMSEVSAAMGLTSLEGLDEFLVANRRNHDQYCRGLADLPGLTLARHEPHDGWNHHYVVLEVDPEAAGLTRDELHRILWAEGVLARRYFYPGAHAMEPYRTLDPDARLKLPATEWLVRRVICLPTGNAIRPTDVDALCAVIRVAISEAPRLRQLLPTVD